MKESTGFADADGVEIFEGDWVRLRVTNPFADMHGTWADYQVVKRPGGYVLLYVRSEKGAQLPLHYTGSYMKDHAVENEGVDIKAALFGSHMPLQVKCFHRVEPEEYETFEQAAERRRAERKAARVAQ